MQNSPGYTGSVKSQKVNGRKYIINKAKAISAKLLELNLKNKLE